MMKKTIVLEDKYDSGKGMIITIDGDEWMVDKVKVGGPSAYKSTNKMDWYKFKYERVED